MATFLTIPSQTDAGGQELLIVGNNSLSLSNVSAQDVRSVFLGKRKSISGVKVTPINAKAGSTLRATFADKVLGMSAAEEKQHWEKEKIMSGGRAPASFSSTAKAVFKVKTGISYVFSSEYNAKTAKVLLRLPAN